MGLKTKKSLLMALLAGVFLTPVVSIADDEALDALNQRMDRLERIVQGQGLGNLITEVDRLQREVQRLNGANDELRHELDKMRDSQRDQYIDLDERLEELATRKPPPADNRMSLSDSADLASQAAADELDGSAGNVDSDSASQETSQSNNNGDDETAYQAALETLRSGQYEEAIVALSSFPQQYPDSSYLPNVYYWQGEANYVIREFDQAIRAFQTVIDDYPESNKVPDALLKRGFSEFENGDASSATETLNTVVEDYPDSSAARLAKVRLDRISQSQ